MLTEEKRMVDLARKGLDKMSPLYAIPPFISKELDEQQRAAVHAVLTSRHQVSILRGAAGSGKTTLMQEAIRRIKDANKKVTVVAPTAQASRGVLKDEGFKNAETVAMLLTDKKLQDDLQDQVLWVDEAGLLGTKDMLAILELAAHKNARVILGGDTRQHASVIRGDALRILTTVGGIKPAEVNNIHRQKNHEYKKAVEDLSKGNIADGFNKLDVMGAIKTIDPMNPNDELVNDYFNTVSNGRSALVISPTHAQGDAVTDAIRKKLRQAGKIGKKEIEAIRYINLNFTEAEKSDRRNFEQGQAIQFNQNMRKIKRGSLWSIRQINGNRIIVENDKGQTISLPEYKSGSYDVYKKSIVKLSKGDSIRITRNGFDKKKKRLNNGDMLKVKSVSKKGLVILLNEKSKAEFTLDDNYGHLAHAFCVTSHSSQGKTVDEVFISQPASTFGATDAKQFYVSVSRGRYAARIYTDDREELLEAAQELGDRQSALELVKQKNVHLDQVIQKQRNAAQIHRKQPDKTSLSKEKISIAKDYEP